MTKPARGTFQIKLMPQEPHDGVNDPRLSRLVLDKTFSGDLEDTSDGQMLGCRTPVEGSMGYVAIERVTATLHGRRGTFVLQHSSTMNRGAAAQSITVVPDSGTDELEGLSGSLTIDIRDGQHFYHFEYELA